MTFGESVNTVLSKYATFSGRAPRSEYWWWFLFVLLVSLVLAFVDVILFGDLQVLGTLFGLAVLLPGLAVSVRRLHDIDKSGWWVLIAFVPVIGVIALLVFFVMPGTDGPNRFG